MQAKEEIAWAAGFFEGEGCVTLIENRFALAVSNTDPWTIERFADIMPVGRVYGPYRNTETDGYRRRPFWAWTVHAEAAMDGMQLLAPWLSPRRIARAHELTGLRFPVERLPI